MTPPHARGPARIATLAALPVAVLVGALVFWILGGFQHSTSGSQRAAPPATGPVLVDAPILDEHTAAVCRALLARLPQSLGDVPRRPVTAGPDQNAAFGDPPIILSCGATRAGIPQDAQLLELSKVCWWPEEKADASVWTTVDRQVSVRVTVPKAVAGEVLVDFSPSIVAAVPTLEAAPARC